MANTLNRRDFIKGVALLVLVLVLGMSALGQTVAVASEGVQATESFIPSSEFKSSFLVSKDDVKNFNNVPHCDMMEGITFSYTIPEEVARKILPPPLELVSPMITGYVVQIKEPSFGGPYMESSVGIPAKYGDISGAYSLSLMLTGPGAQCGLIVGDQGCGIPKKIADEIEVRRQANRVYAKVVRHGTILLELEADLDGEVVLGDVNQMNGRYGSFYHKYDMIQTEQGNTVFSNLRLVSEYVSIAQKSSQSGRLLSLKVQSTPDDPYGELAMVEPVSAQWIEWPVVIMEHAKVLAQLDVDEVMPYLMSGRFDRSMMGYKSTYFNVK
jgi:acetoacetate decarboxylase